MKAGLSRDVSLRIRVGMDVYTALGDRYLGSVVRLWHGPRAEGGHVRPVEAQGSVENTPLVHEEGHTTDHAGAQGQRQNGEEMGPYPTASAGNTGPSAQSVGANYATRETDGRTDVTHFAVRPGRINLGVLTRSFYVPSSEVESVSMERILLKVDAIPLDWHRRPQR